MSKNKVVLAFGSYLKYGRTLKVKGKHLYTAYFLLAFAVFIWWAIWKLIGKIFPWPITFALALAGFMIITSVTLAVPTLENILSRFIGRMPGGSDGGSVYQATITILCGTALVEIVALSFKIQELPINTIISSYLIIIALVLWFLRSTTQNLEHKKISSLLVPGIVTLYFALFCIPYQLEHPSWLFDLIGIELPAIAQTSREFSWLFAQVILSFCVIVEVSQNSLVLLRTILTGMLIGALASFHGAFSLVSLSFALSTPFLQVISPLYIVGFLTSFLLLFLFLILAGPIAIFWSRTRKLRERLVVGMISGAIVGFIIFGFLGAPTAGIIANKPIMQVFVDPASYAFSDKWTLLFVESVSATIPLTYILLFITLGISSTLGLIGAWISPFHSRAPRQINSQNTIWPLVLQTTLMPVLYLIVFFNTAIFSLLSSQIQETYETLNGGPSWNPELVLTLNIYPSLFVLLFFSIITLIWYRRLATHSPVRRSAILAARYLFILFLLFGFLLFLINPSYILSISGLPHWIILAYCFILMQNKGRIPNQTQSFNTLPENVEHPTLTAWFSAGAISGLLLASLIFVTITSVYNTTLIGIAILGEIPEPGGPLPSTDILRDTFLSLQTVTGTTFIIILTVGILYGLIVSAILARFASTKR